MPTPTPTPIPTPSMAPTLIPTPTPVATPSPSPSVLHVVTDGAAPVWQGPLLTGLFVLGAAIITLISLYYSDRRKLKREDRRQWDNELKQGYVAILARTQEVSRGLTLARSDGIDKLGDAVVAALEQSREQQLLFELIAPQRVTQAVKDLSIVLLEIYQKTFTSEREELPSLSWSVGLLAELTHREDLLRDEIRRALRTPRR